MDRRQLGFAAGFGFFLTSLVTMLVTGGVFFLALGQRRTIDVLGAFTVEVASNGAFEVSFSIWYLVGFALLFVVVAGLTWAVLRAGQGGFGGGRAVEPR